MSRHADTPIGIVLIDDNRLLREGLRALMRSEPGLRILAASATAAEAVDRTRDTPPDVALVARRLSGRDSLLEIAELRAEFPRTGILVKGILPAQESIVDYVRAGATGFIMRDASFEDLVNAIGAAVEGVCVVPDELSCALFEQIAAAPVKRARALVPDSIPLTNRERQVFNLIAEGLSNKEIAARMGISVHTVKTHIHRTLAKLEVSSRLEVAVLHRTLSDGEPQEQAVAQ
ncbi:MAG: LuxR C-terminal-related transcriptional regulator [Gemmatimonadales bacterium]